MALIIELQVIPASGRNAWSYSPSGLIKVFLKKPAEKGKANAELIKNLAKKIGCSQSEVTLVSGATSRKKRIKLSCDITFEHLLEKLGIERQQSLFE